MRPPWRGSGAPTAGGGPRPARSAGAGARLEEVLGPARRSLGELGAAALLEEGRAMGADEAVRYAMGTPPAAPPAANGAAAAFGWLPQPRSGSSPGHPSAGP